MSEIDPRFIERRPPADCVIGLSFSKNDSNSFLGKNHGTVANGAIVNNGYATFAGTDDIMTISSSSDLILTNKFSISIWFNPTTTPATGRTLIGRRATDLHNYRSYMVIYSTSSIELLISQNSITDMSYAFSGSFPSSGWNHLGATYNGTLSNGNRWNAVLNGVVLTSPTISNDANLTPYDYAAIGTSIGANGWPAPSIGIYLDWVGHIDNVLLMNNRALTNQELKDLYSHGRQE